ncbi:PRC-barrel domain-containing protein [Pedobacter metabolipauper]|uniref:PRC-barrel domain protein n=1 Tax=Pedobacter metabolipauper TaxID=425513 RepID=A0A4R6SY17_9SPHI|nr:PRC-barrel domain-containing protein [Pedobacter metabolipauper]TDQ10937.1 PRC-barrel domain protein [Pedobacter metabolipauper]
MTAEETLEYRRLVALSESDFEIADGDPEIQGWHIKDDLGERIGEVTDLLFNPSTKKVRYVVADLEPLPLSAENRRILIPIGLAELHESDDEVFLPGVTPMQLAAVPLYTTNEVTQEYEIWVLDAFRDPDDSLNDREIHIGDQFYSHRHFNDHQFYNKRFPDRGRVR